MSKPKYRLNESFEVNGYWWLPDASEIKIAGKLDFHPNREMILNLFGSLNPSATVESNNIFEPKIILGLLEDGEYCTLLDTFQTYYSPGTEIIKSTFAVNLIIIGEIFHKKSDIKFNSANFELTNLNNWVMQKCFDKKPEKGNIFNVKYKRPKDDKYSIKSINATLTISSRADIKSGYYMTEISHYNYIRLRPKRKKALNWFLGTIYEIRNLIAILTAERIFIDRIGLELKTNRMKLPTGKFISRYVDIIYLQAHYEKTKPVHPIEMPFSYSLVKRNFQNIANAWFEEKEKGINSAIYDVFFNSLYNKSLNIELEFLSLMQSIEGMHRALGNDKYMDENEYEKVRCKISNSIPNSLTKDHKDALKSRIQFGNEYSLRKRMNLIFKDLDKELVGLITNDYKNFVTRVVDNRNYLTHYDKNSLKNKMTWNDMYTYSAGLRTLLVCLIYKTIGIESATLIRVMKENKKFRQPELTGSINIET